ncbi:methyltransferase domain-containing protein [Ruminococcaceae bacterium OttesenSCG-928-I18]|nr:methyltransferase domain-containing protein [Ruminococcaceae bacterium OttesenSCG-928-I18]
MKSEIDHGKPHSWGKIADRYAKYRDIYPPVFFERLHHMGVGQTGQRVLDLGTGTGVLPRGMARYGAHFIGVDSDPGQIKQAVRLATEAGLDIPFHTLPAEEIDFGPGSFDGVTACQCYPYFDRKKVLPKLHKILKKDGKFAVLALMWLPNEDKIAYTSEELVLKHNPSWTGGGYRRGTPIPAQEEAPWFRREDEQRFELALPFTRESWAGRMLACRGTGAALTPGEAQAFAAEHEEILKQTTPPEFTVLHEATILLLKPER